jgi:hypothetical protein
VVEAGRISERGTHSSLYAAGGRYYDLYTRQHGIESDLFLAPGEGDSEPEDVPRADAASGREGNGGTALPEAIRMIRERSS